MSEQPKLGLLGATTLVATTMIGSGIFLLPSTLGAVGSISLISWGVAAAGAVVLALVFGLLGNLRPDADGVVDYAAEALHPALGHLTWVLYWLVSWVGTTAVAVGAVGYLAFFFPVLKLPAPLLIATLGLIWLLVLANIVGARLVARIGGATLALGLVPIILVVGAGLTSFDAELFAASWNVTGKSDLAAMSGAVTPIFWAFTGFEAATIAAKVIENPKRNLALAGIGGVLIAGIIYVSASAAILGLMPAKALAASTAPFADAITPIAGVLAAGILALCALAKAIGSLGGSTLLIAETGRAGVAGGFLPRLASGSPTRDCLVAGGLMSVATLASASPTLGAQFSILINTTVILSMTFYLICSLVLLRLARQMTSAGGRLLAGGAAVAGMGFCIWVIATTDPALRPPALIICLASLVLWGATQLRARLRAT